MTATRQRPTTATATTGEVRARQVEEIGLGLDGAKERLTWPQEQLCAFRDERLRALLAHARDRSPWHRDRLAGIDLDHLAGHDLSALPIMTKADLMANWDRIVTDERLTLAAADRHLATIAAGGELGYLAGDITVVATGGSTGHRAVIAIDHAGLVGFAVSALRSTAWLHDRGLLPRPAGPRPVRATLASSSPVHIGGVGARLLGGSLMDGRTFPPAMPVADMVEGLNRLQPDQLFGYASVLHRLALEAEAGRLQISPGLVRQAGEPLLPETAALLEAAFGAAVQNSYGASEGYFAESPPSAPWLHLAEDAGVFEFVDAHNRAVAPGEAAAKILFTNLVNHLQPLVRYEITDQTTLLDGPGPGRCPWTGQRIAPPTGRTDDWFPYGPVLVHPHVFRSVLAPLAAVAEYQVRQTPGGATVDVVAVGPFDAATVARRLSAQLAAAGVSGPSVTVRSVPAIERHHGSGKLRRFVPLPK